MRDGFPDHQRRVADNFRRDSVEHRVALFHDHIEDHLGLVPEGIRSYVEILTRRRGETYRSYISRIVESGNRVAIAVKLADARDNLARCRGEHGGSINSKLAKRYEKAIEALSHA